MDGKGPPEVRMHPWDVEMITLSAFPVMGSGTAHLRVSVRTGASQSPLQSPPHQSQGQAKHKSQAAHTQKLKGAHCSLHPLNEIIIYPDSHFHI